MRGGGAVSVPGGEAEHAASRRPTDWLHPLAVVLCPIPALVAVFIVDRPWFGLVAAACCVLLAFARGVRAGLGTLFTLAVIGAVCWLGMALWLPPEAARLGATRMVAAGALMVVPTLFVVWTVLVDTLIHRFRVPYRLMDAMLLGERFAQLLRSDARVAATVTVLRSRHRIARRLRLLPRMGIAVLVMSFRQSEELAIAMDARGFGTYSCRTVHHSRAVSVGSCVALGITWVLTAFVAVLFESV